MKEVLAAFPRLRRSGSYLYRQPVKEVLVGYLVEIPPSGPRLLGVRFPLYEMADFIHLDYSVDLANFMPDGSRFDHRNWLPAEGSLRPFTEEELEVMRPQRMTAELERAFAVRLVSFIQQDFARLDEREDVRGFAKSLRLRARDEPYFQKTLALTLVMLGELDEARRLIKDLLCRLTDTQFPEIHIRDLERTLDSIDAGAAAARGYRLDVIRVMRSKFSLPD